MCQFFGRSIAQTNGSNTDDAQHFFQTMHVHFDKDIYLPGETIWFKAYLYNINEVSLAATNFYVAIYDEKGKQLQQKQYPIVGGSCNGDLAIPDTIEGSRLQFRAFTIAMIAEDSNNVYEKILSVYNKKTNADNQTQPKTKQLQFFAEGGQVIAELQNTIAIKATYTDGSPAKISGEIIEVERGMLVDSFFTNTMGMGTFALTPLPHKTYKAVWTDENGKEQETKLPTVTRYGVSFHATVSGNQLQYDIAKNITTDSLSVLHLLAQMGNKQAYRAELVIKNEMELSSANFSIDSMPEGLLQLTLFDKYWNKLQERLVFINEKIKQALIAVKSDTINFAPKGKNTIEINLADTTFTDLSVSIADINFYEKPNLHSIKQDLLLNTQLLDLKNDATLFLDNGNNSTINLLSLTHQWKRYNWQKLVTKTLQQPLDNYIGLSINYKEKNYALPKDDALNLILSKGQLKQFYNLTAFNQTTFKKDGLVFFDSVKVLYQMNRNKEIANFLSVTKDSGLKIPLWISALPEKINFQTTQTQLLKNKVEAFSSFDTGKFNGVKTFKEVVVKSKFKGNPVLERLDELDKFYTSGMFSGSRGYQLNVIDDTLGVATNKNVQDYIRFRVPGLYLVDGVLGKHKTIMRTDKKTGHRFVGDTMISPLIFIDEVEVTHYKDLSGFGGVGGDDGLSLLNISDVAYIKYIPGLVVGAGFNSVDGAIYVYTKTGREKGPSLKGLPFVYIKGYNLPKEFVEPDYSDKALTLNPDLRTTLYWNPNAEMDKVNNTLKIDYYNNDVSKKHLLKIEGVNAAGQLIYLEKILE